MQNSLESLNTAACCTSLRDKPITINGKEYTLFWTVHAAHRAIYRNNKNTIIFNVFIEDFLRNISMASIFPSLEGNVTMRDYKTGIYAVINIDKVNHVICVITCGSVNRLYPQNNDVVIQRNADNTVTKYLWKYQPKAV